MKKSRHFHLAFKNGMLGPGYLVSGLMLPSLGILDRIE